MKLIEWPLDTDGTPIGITNVLPEELEDTEAWIACAAGAYYVVPKHVVLNMKTQYECIKKAEGQKATLPLVTLCYEQLVGMPYCVAAALLGE